MRTFPDELPPSIPIELKATQSAAQTRAKKLLLAYCEATMLQACLSFKRELSASGTSVCILWAVSQMSFVSLLDLRAVMWLMMLACTAKVPCEAELEGEIVSHLMQLQSFQITKEMQLLLDDFIPLNQNQCYLKAQPQSTTSQLPPPGWKTMTTFQAGSQRVFSSADSATTKSLYAVEVGLRALIFVHRTVMLSEVKLPAPCQSKPKSQLSSIAKRRRAHFCTILLKDYKWQQRRINQQDHFFGINPKPMIFNCKVIQSFSFRFPQL